MFGARGSKSHRKGQMCLFVLSSLLKSFRDVCVSGVCSSENENRDADTDRHLHTGDEWCLGSRGCTSLGRRTNFVPSSELCLSFLASDKPAETVRNNGECRCGGGEGHKSSMTGTQALSLASLYCMLYTWVPGS